MIRYTHHGRQSGNPSQTDNNLKRQGYSNQSKNKRAFFPKYKPFTVPNVYQQVHVNRRTNSLIPSQNYHRPSKYQRTTLQRPRVQATLPRYKNRHTNSRPTNYRSNNKPNYRPLIPGRPQNRPAISHPHPLSYPRRTQQKHSPYVPSHNGPLKIPSHSAFAWYPHHAIRNEQPTLIPHEYYHNQKTPKQSINHQSSEKQNQLRQSNVGSSTKNTLNRPVLSSTNLKGLEGEKRIHSVEVKPIEEDLKSKPVISEVEVNDDVKINTPAAKRIEENVDQDREDENIMIPEDNKEKTSEKSEEIMVEESGKEEEMIPEEIAEEMIQEETEKIILEDAMAEENENMMPAESEKSEEMEEMMPAESEEVMAEENEKTKSKEMIPEESEGMMAEESEEIMPEEGEEMISKEMIPEQSEEVMVEEIQEMKSKEMIPEESQEMMAEESQEMKSKEMVPEEREETMAEESE